MAGMFCLAFLVPAIGGDLPARPDPATPVDGQCMRAVDLGPDDELGCRATAVPTSDLADLLADRVWATQLQGHLRICDAELKAERKSLPRTVVFGVGVGVGIGAVLVGAWSVGQVAR